LSIILLAVILFGSREQSDIVTYNYSGNDGCSFTVSIGQPVFRSYMDRWYPVVNGMGVSYEQDEYVQPSLICYIPVPPECEPGLRWTFSGSQPVSLPGQPLVTPVMIENGLDTEWQIPSIVPAAEADNYVELQVVRLFGTTVARVEIYPFGGGIAGSIPLEISVHLEWPSAGSPRSIDSPLLGAIVNSELPFWPQSDRTDAPSPF